MPPKRSDRPPSLRGRASHRVAQGTARQLLELLQKNGIRPVTLRHKSQYCSRVLSNSGAQFVVYMGDGVNTFDKGSVVVKCSRLRAGKDGKLPKGEQDRDRAAALYREVQILTHWRLQSHPNIPTLLWYDFIDTGDNLHMPALIMERAEVGSLSTLLHSLSQRPPLTDNQRIKLCANVTAGLLVLHQVGVIHGDVKVENVLVFSSANAEGPYVGKIADFGSAIIVGEQEEPDAQHPWRYLGTPTTNAPEVSNQTSMRLDAKGLRKCDNYSLGLLILEVALGYLDEEAEGKTPNVLQHAVVLLESTDLPDLSKTTIQKALKCLLQFKPEDRCGDLSIIEHILDPLPSEQLGLQNLHLDSRGNSLGFKDGFDLAAVLKDRFGIADYLDVNLDVEQQAEWDTQALVVKQLSEASKKRKNPESGKALFQLALANACGFGMPYNEDKTLDYATAAARNGYLPAQANTTAFYMALGRKNEIDQDEHLDWLFEAAAWGSFVAAECLRQLSLHAADRAREAFHQAGGYNQFFHSGEPPSYVHSIEFAKFLMGEQQGDLGALAEAAAIYGNAPLLRQLFELGVNPNLTNSKGESLLLLCCKGGHLDVLKVLARLGAKITTKGHQHSPLHWLVAFDESEVNEAAQLLRSVSSELEEKMLPDMPWNHPSIDLPGRFPLGSPLHYTVFADALVHTQSILEHFPEIPLNWMGSSTVSPLEFGIPRFKIQAARLLIEHGAIPLQPASDNILAEFGSTLLPETWAAMAKTRLTHQEIVDECLNPVLEQDPKLINTVGEGGFTPLMSAAQYHDCTVIHAMLQHGADVHASTSIEYDGRTALNLITTNKAQWPVDDCTFELLVAAGANPDEPSLPGGKQLLHFASRDDDVVTAQKIINMALNSSLDPEMAKEAVFRVVNSRTVFYGQTPLHVAAQYGSIRVARLLLEYGADVDVGHYHGTVNAWDWDGLTALAVAACTKQTSIIQLLLDNGCASGLARPNSHHSILHLSVAEPDNGAMLQMLLGIPGIKSNVKLLNSPAEGGVTPLHLCAGNLGRTQYARLLIDSGANPVAHLVSGHSVLDVALALQYCLASFLDSFERILVAGSQAELASFLAQGADLWLPVTQGGGQFSLVLKMKKTGEVVSISVSEMMRYHDEFNGENKINLIGANSEDDPTNLDLDEMLVEVNNLVDIIYKAGGTISMADPVPKNLLALSLKA